MTGDGGLLHVNLAALRLGGNAAKHATAAKVAASQLSPRLRVEDSRGGGTGEPTAMLSVPEGELSLHSRYRPRAEAEKLARGTTENGCDYLILYGFGLGYEAEAMIDLTPQLELRVIEPDPSLLYTAFCNRDLRRLLGLAQVVLICEDSEFDAIERLDYLPFFFPQLKTTHLRARLAADDEYFRNFAQQLEHYIAAAGNDYRACAAYGRRWCVNTIRNLGLLKRSQPVTSFPRTTQWSIVGAGPSADPEVAQSIPASTLYCDTAIRTGVVTSTERLTAVTIDPQPISKLHYLGVPPGQVRLIADIGAHHSLLQQFPDVRFVSSGHPLHRYLSTQGLPLGPVVVQGGSVSETALRLAHYHGAQDIVLTGLDFSYCAEKSYVAGSWLESYLRYRSTRLHSLIDQQYEFIQARKAARRTDSHQEREAVTYHTQLLDDYQAAFLGAASELGFTYFPGKSFKDPARLRVDPHADAYAESHSRPGGNLPAAENETQPVREGMIAGVLRGLKEQLLKDTLPHDDTSFSAYYRSRTAPRATLIPAAIFFHERRGLSRCEAISESCTLMLTEISRFTADGR